jgi:hypothetical protein
VRRGDREVHKAIVNETGGERSPPLAPTDERVVHLGAGLRV